MLICVFVRVCACACLVRVFTHLSKFLRRRLVPALPWKGLMPASTATASRGEDLDENVGDCPSAACFILCVCVSVQQCVSVWCVRDTKREVIRQER